MENVYARRNFLKNVALATSGVAFLSSTSALQAFTGGNSPEGYNPYSEEKTDLRTSFLFGTHITVKGKVLSKSNLTSVSNATIEVWHLSPNSNKFRHQAKMTADANGEYSFITDFPNREKGKYPKVFFKISNGNNVTYTELSLTESNAYINHKHYAEHAVLGNQMFPTMDDTNNQKTVTFNTVI